MGSYRSRLDIQADILQVVKKNAKKRQMFQANLNYKFVQKYLRNITVASLIDFETTE